MLDLERAEDPEPQRSSLLSTGRMLERLRAPWKPRVSAELGALSGLLELEAHPWRSKK